jgi:Flp pilus assembly protein TadB
VKRNRKSRPGLKRRRKFAWLFSASAVVIGLLYWEQAAVLYVLSTLAMCAVLLIVAFSNLEARDKAQHKAALDRVDARDAESTHVDLSKKEAA